MPPLLISFNFSSIAAILAIISANLASSVFLLLLPIKAVVKNVVSPNPVSIGGIARYLVNCPSDITPASIDIVLPQKAILAFLSSFLVGGACNFSNSSNKASLSASNFSFSIFLEFLLLANSSLTSLFFVLVSIL